VSLAAALPIARRIAFHDRLPSEAAGLALAQESAGTLQFRADEAELRPAAISS
jgi:hypothetical protein